MSPTTLELVSCPHYEDDPEQRCGLPSEVLGRSVMESTSGPVELIKIRCILGHYFNCPVDMLGSG
jgi:hypothetical protein